MLRLAGATPTPAWAGTWEWQPDRLPTGQTNGIFSLEQRKGLDFFIVERNSFYYAADFLSYGAKLLN